MNRQKKLTKREQKALRPARPGAGGQVGGGQQHIHCTACGRHIDPSEFDGTAPTATHLRCAHNGSFTSCVACADRTRELLDTHDRTGQPVQAASAWH